MPDEADHPYQALYRRFRPQRFSEVLGQEHVTRALRSAVRDGKVAHAYLFSGPRGTGKTSTARILAMALNCANPVDGEPDGTCESCVAVRQGISMDVQELDSATNRGIDEMRDLLSRVALGSPGRWKVYIVDEVHQMTSAASSALLKTLEEPPAHVIFVLATTDPQKVMETIRSRTQHFEFRLLGADVLSAHLAHVAEQADLELPREAIDLAVRRGHGSARDALSALDQVAAAGGAEDDLSAARSLVDAIIERDAAAALVAVAEAAHAGLDPRRLGSDLLEYLRNGFLATRARSLVLLDDEAAAEAEDRARRLGAAAVVRSMEVIGTALIDMREAADARTTLEVALVRLSAPEVDDSRAALLERIERLERAASSDAQPRTSPPVRPAAAPPPRPAPSAATASGTSAGADAVVPPPTSPEGGSAASRSALGAHRRPASAAPDRTATSPAAATAKPSVPPAPAATTPPAAAPATPPVPPATPASRPVTPPAAAAAAASEPAGSLPSREELTLAWGDKILPSLRPAIKVYVASGRFLASNGPEAVYAVPDQGLLTRAQPGRADVERALSEHFGRPVPLRLVLDDDPQATAPGGTPGRAAPAASPGPRGEADPEEYDLTDLEDAPGTVLSPEQRLMEAFPGAEEVTQ